MEVEIAALYNTMHINLQWTDRSRVWSWGYGFKYGYWLICTLCHCLWFQDIHLLWFPLSFVPQFCPQSLTVFYSKSGISEREVQQMQALNIISMKSNLSVITLGGKLMNTYSHHRYLQNRPTNTKEDIRFEMLLLVEMLYKRKTTAELI